MHGRTTCRCHRNRSTDVNTCNDEQQRHAKCHCRRAVAQQPRTLPAAARLLLKQRQQQEAQMVQQAGVQKLHSLTELKNISVAIQMSKL